MLKATESVQKINEARQAEEEDVTDADPLEEQDDDPQVTGEAQQPRTMHSTSTRTMKLALLSMS